MRALLPLLAMLLLVPGMAMADEVTARAEYNKTTKVLRLVMDDQTPTDDNTLVVKLLDPKTNKSKWFDNKYDYCEWPDDFRSAQSVVIDESFKDYELANCLGMFTHFKSLEGISGLEYLNTANVTDMSYMFQYCESLKTLDMSKLNTDNVTDMRNMFSSCRSLKTLDVSKLNTANVTNMNSMFYTCVELETLDVSKFNTAKVTNMKDMFNSCVKLETLDVSKFNTDNVTDMSGMFYQCYNVKTLDVSKFNTDNVTDMSGMFYLCNKINTIDLSSFNTAKVRNMKEMFHRCTSLTKIYVSDQFTTESVSSSNDMFYNCYGLPNFYSSSNVIDKTNAHYRAGGYLTTYYRTADGEIHELSGDELKVDKLELDDSKYFVARAPFTATSATYSRTLSGGATWATLCLPFEVSLEGQNFRAFRVASVSDDDNVELEELTASIAAGTPVIIKMAEGATDISISEGDRPIATAPKADAQTDAQYQLAGLYAPRTFDKAADSNCYIVKGDKLMNPSKLLENTNTTTVGSKAFRAYLKENATTVAPARMLSLGGQTTAIDKIADTLNGDAQYFDLQGRCLDAPQKGMNIVRRGGKTTKIMIR